MKENTKMKANVFVFSHCYVGNVTFEFACNFAHNKNDDLMLTPQVGSLLGAMLMS